jgi:hypothetical protein
MKDVFDNLPDLSGSNSQRKVKRVKTRSPKERSKEVFPPVIWKAPRCPKCNLIWPPVTKTMPPVGKIRIRYHKCVCGLDFKSVME